MNLRGGTRRVVIIDIRNEYNDPSSNPGRNCLHFK